MPELTGFIALHDAVSVMNNDEGDNESIKEDTTRLPNSDQGACLAHLNTDDDDDDDNVHRS